MKEILENFLEQYQYFAVFVIIILFFAFGVILSFGIPYLLEKILKTEFTYEKSFGIYNCIMIIYLLILFIILLNCMH